VQVDAGVVNPISILPDVPVIVGILWTRVILRVVDENHARGLHIAGRKVVHHPESVVEDTLVVEMQIVGVRLPIIASRVRVGGVAFAISPHIGKSGVVVIYEPRVNTVGGGGIVPDAESALTVKGQGRICSQVGTSCILQVQRVDVESVEGWDQAEKDLSSNQD